MNDSVLALVMDVYKGLIVQKLKIDNAAAVSISSEGVGSWRTRHLKIRHGWLREKFSSGTLQI